jgi:oligoribonuclease NrnB/cAMP/cGMP phosphodiesterase (DHH superfamily)
MEIQSCTNGLANRGRESMIEFYLGIKIINPMEIVKMNMLSIENKKPLVIYHGNCADGFSAAWVFYHWGKEIEQGFDFHAGVYNDAPPDDVEGRIVYLVDFSYKRDIVKEICKKAAAVVLIDHHKTAIDDLGWLVDEGSTEYQSNFDWYVHLDKSGAMLAWDYCFNDSCQIVDKAHPEYRHPPMLLNHVEDRDLWKFKLPLTREIQANVFSYEYTFENWDKLMLETSTLQLAEGGMAIERKHFKDIRELIAVAKRIITFKLTDTVVTMPCLNVPYFFSSDAGHIMASEDYTKMAACYFDTADNRIFSLRSTEDGPDVSEIAKFYGGGGHKHAAGFRVSREHELAKF